MNFAELAAEPAPPLDRLLLALAAEFRTVDEAAALAQLDALGERLTATVAGDDDPVAQARACAALLGGEEGFEGAVEDHEHPDNLLLDCVLARRRGRPETLAAVYVEAARRAEVPLAGVGLPRHFLVGHFGAPEPLLLDPFARGFAWEGDLDYADVEPWGATDTAMRVLNELISAFRRAGSHADAVHAAGMRLALPVDDAQREALERELARLRARLG